MYNGTSKPSDGSTSNGTTKIHITQNGSEFQQYPSTHKTKTTPNGNYELVDLTLNHEIATQLNNEVSAQVNTTPNKFFDASDDAIETSPTSDHSMTYSSPETTPTGFHLENGNSYIRKLSAASSNEDQGSPRSPRSPRAGRLTLRKKLRGSQSSNSSISSAGKVF